jgi:hypothetical protein
MLAQNVETDRRSWQARRHAAPRLPPRRIEAAMSEQERTGTFASRVLARHPELRKRALESDDFQKWLKSYATVDVDGTQFYVMGGDMLRDQDEMMLNWIRRQGLIDQKAIERLQSEEPSDHKP